MKLTGRSGSRPVFEGVLARKLDFGDGRTTVTSTGRWERTALYLASRGGGPDKYRALEARRRAAQIAARRLLARMEGNE